jgi:hypothetical protein
MKKRVSEQAAGRGHTGIEKGQKGSIHTLSWILRAFRLVISFHYSMDRMQF